MEIISTLQRPPQIRQTSHTSQIKDIQVFGESSGVAFTSDTLFRTEDNGESWREIALPRNFDETISGVSFLNENVGFVILADRQRTRFELAKTNDGGISWARTEINLRTEDLQDADFDNTSLELSDDSNIKLTLRLSSSSNFIRRAVYITDDGGQTWNFESSRASNPSEDHAGLTESANAEIHSKLKLSEAESIIRSSIEKNSAWLVTSSGNCEGFKVGCTQTTKLYRYSDINDLKEITPTKIKELSKIEKDKAKIEAQNSVFANPPNGSTRLSLNRGFDKCTAATPAQMQAWWNNSPFYDVNIYMSGRNRGCSQPQLTAAWVNTVSAQGWGFIPTVVGYQTPCTASTTSVKHSFDPGIAETQGRGEADIAIADANNLGLTQGTVLYYDMERYDETVNTPGCRVATSAFLKGWTDRVKEQGYISGVYGSPFNANGDWVNIPLASRMDVVWLARWNNVMSVWGVAPLADTVWTNHQRIHQWLGPRDETWGGVTFNIDNNISDAPVAGAAIAKNKTADFDGDGKSDISVWRPDTGVWYIANSANASYTIQGFGVASDILAPGDYDGNGKTDLAVFRPETGVWHLYSRSIYRSFQFGTSGDIPVPADYNGDGYTDMAVFRPSNGTWYIWNTSGSPNPYRTEQFGVSGDKPVQGDYDGDGKTDLGIFRNGTWYLYQSQNGVSVTQFGLAGDLPVTGDFDGDSKSDIAVFRPSSGIWYLLQSLNGFSATQFGIANDKPIPNAYLPQ